MTLPRRGLTFTQRGTRFGSRSSVTSQRAVATRWQFLVAGQFELRISRHVGIKLFSELWLASLVGAFTKHFSPRVFFFVRRYKTHARGSVANAE